MKSPMSRVTSVLNPFERVLLGAVFMGGGFLIDASGMTRGAVLAVGGDVDLSPITFLHCAFFCFCSRVSMGVIVSCLTELEEEKFIVIICQVHSFSFFLFSALQVHMSYK